MTVVVENKFGPAFFERCYQGRHEGGRTDARHVFETERDAADSGLFGHAHDLAGHVDHGLGGLQTVVDVNHGARESAMAAQRAYRDG